MSEGAIREPGLTTQDRLLLTLIGALTLFYYSYLMTRAFGSLFVMSNVGMTFNNMLDQLLIGRFDVDPEVISREGFLHNGKVYAYFGIVPALLRLPLRLFLDLHALDVTALMCVLSIWLGGLFQAAAVLVIRRAAPTSQAQSLGTITLLLAIIFAGAQVPYLRPSIYQEVGSWAMAFASMFVYWAVRGVIDQRGFTRALLIKMAFAAGLALATRVTIGLGLYIALSCLILAMALRARVRNWRTLLPALLVLAGFVLLAGAVNAMRWGKPWQFAPIHLQIMNDYFPGRLDRLAQYGYFNPLRIPFGLGYYFFPIWGIVGEDGRFLFADFQERAFDAVELPPSSFLLTEPLLLLLFAGLLHWRHELGDRLWHVWPLLCGLAVPPLLMLSAWYLAYRYRLEFEPFFLFGGLLGFHLLCRRGASNPERPLLRGPLLVASLVGVAASQLSLQCYQMSALGDAGLQLAQGRLGPGLFSYYAPVLGF